MAKRILFIDDDEKIRVLVKRVLQSADYDVDTAKDGIEGLSAALTGNFDLIICDVMMPLMDGYELCKELRQDDRTRTVPLIVATARAATLTERTAALYNAEYLPKPFRIDELKSLVARLITR